MNKVFIDLGAHLGESVLRFYKEVRDAAKYKIYAFEPNPNLFAVLRKSLEHLSNVEIISKAATDRDGKINLFLGSINNADGSTLVLGKKTGNIDYNKPIEVSAIDFSKWLVENTKDTDYIVLKINIEGSEYEIMKNLLQLGMLSRIYQIYLVLHAHKINGNEFQIVADEIKSKFFTACKNFGVAIFVTNDGHKKFNCG